MSRWSSRFLRDIGRGGNGLDKRLWNGQCRRFWFANRFRRRNRWNHGFAALGVCLGLLLAAHAQGIGAVWRTGEFSYDPRVLEGLGLTEQERLLGFLYMGTPEGRVRSAPVLEPKDFVQRWNAQ